MLTGKAIRLARVNKGLLVRELAVRAGISHTLLSFVERGVTPLTDTTEMKLIKAFESVGVTRDELHRFKEVSKS